MNLFKLKNEIGTIKMDVDMIKYITNMSVLKSNVTSSLKAKVIGTKIHHFLVISMTFLDSLFSILNKNFY